jgi:hypothetical protein
MSVPQNQPTVETALSATSVIVGTPVHDTATLPGATAAAGGTVTYKVLAGTACSGAAAFTSTQIVTEGAVPNSGSYSPPSVGTYSWQATFSASETSTAASATSTCLTETLSVPKNPTQVATTSRRPQHRSVRR